MTLDPKIILSLSGDENQWVSYASLCKFVQQARALGYRDTAWVRLLANDLSVRATPANLPFPALDTEAGCDVEGWCAELETRIEEIAGVVEQRTAASPAPEPSEHAPSHVDDVSADLLAIAEADLAQCRQRLTEVVQERDAAANKLEKTAADLKRVQGELHTAKTVNARRPEKERVLVGDAEVVKAIEKLLLRIAAHRASSHGGRMADSVDQALYDAMDEVSKQFNAETYESVAANSTGGEKNK